MNEELHKLYIERLKSFDPSLVPAEAAGYFAVLCDMLTGSTMKEMPAGQLASLHQQAQSPESTPCKAAQSAENMVQDPRQMFRPLGERKPVLSCWMTECAAWAEKEPDPDGSLYLRIAETSIRLLCACEEAKAETGAMPPEKVLRDIVWSYLHDYAADHTEDYLRKGAGGELLFIKGDPFWNPAMWLPGGKTGKLEPEAAEHFFGGCGEHREDLALFWGDRLRAAKLEALERVLTETAADGRQPGTGPAAQNGGEFRGTGNRPDGGAETSRFTLRQQNSLGTYVEKAAELLTAAPRKMEKKSDEE